MNRILIYATAFLLTISGSLISTSYASTKTDDNEVPATKTNLQFNFTQWRIVKHSFLLHIPQNKKTLSQLIVDVPSTVAVSNDIDVLDENGQKININVSVNSRRIILDIPEPETISSKTKLIVELNKVKQPIHGQDSIYSLFAKLVGSDVEIPLGVARFHTF
ncbi:MAG: hypothetical protein KME46_19680 [Brasilonema angustatum HA4187-MV1]|jgi:hypothetical protein|nr:hypothetical protein [Brasilonema angustatum HA4187-MV1]